MNEEKLKEFNTKLKALLDEYQISLQVEEVPATKRIVVVPIEQKTTGTDEPSK